MIYLIDRGPTRPADLDRYSMMVQDSGKPVVLGGQARILWMGEDMARCREWINNLRELERKRKASGSVGNG